MGTNRACAKDKPASGPLARRGSNPFPGAVFCQKLSGITLKQPKFGNKFTSKKPLCLSRKTCACKPFWQIKLSRLRVGFTMFCLQKIFMVCT
jgi:hypothetical protein